VAPGEPNDNTYVVRVLSILKIVVFVDSTTLMVESENCIFCLEVLLILGML